MLLCQSSAQACPDRTGQCISFRESIDQLALSKKGASWEGPISTYEPTKISPHRKNANSDQLLYAADILMHFYPDIVIEQVKDDNELSCYHNKFDLDITVQDWEFAHNIINNIHKQQVDKLKYMLSLLNEFSTYACRGDVSCRAKHRSTLEDIQIGRHAWNADAKALWSRYVQGTINIARPGEISTDKDHIILVDAAEFKKIVLESGIDLEERRRFVIERLREHAETFPLIAPEGGKKYLIPNIARYLHIKRSEANALVISVVGNKWRNRGKRKKEDAIASKERRVIPDSTI